MQRLHLVGFTSELDGLIFSASSGARSGGYVVALDAELLNVIRDVLARRDAPRAAAAPVARSAARPGGSVRPGSGPAGSALAPRDIQARLRAGRTVGEVALEAGVDDEWVRRFATPVFAEQAHVVSRALAVVFHADGTDPSAEALLGSVAANLVARGVVLTSDELASGWSAYQMRDTAWVVQFRTSVGAKEIMARWGFDVRAGTLVALNRPAAELGWVGGSRHGQSAFAAVEEFVTEAGDDRAANDGVSREGALGEGAGPVPTRPQRAPTARKRAAGADSIAGRRAGGEDSGAARVPAGVDGAASRRSAPSPRPNPTRRRSASAEPQAGGQAALPLTAPAAGAAVRRARRRAAPGE